MLKEPPEPERREGAVESQRDREQARASKSAPRPESNLERGSMQRLASSQTGSVRLEEPRGN